MIRRYGDPVGARTRYTHRPGAYAVLSDGRDLLLTYQADPHHEFQLPGGGIDPGEQPVPALHREVLEETGWRISIAHKIGTYRRFVLMPEYEIWAEKICHIYMARPVRRLSAPREAGHSAVWMTPELAASRLASPGDRAFVQQVFRL